jgi:S1-C subfamily serine protease
MQSPLIVTVVSALTVILSGKEWKGIVAIEAGLMAGDVIKKVNNKDVKDIKSFKEIIKKVDISKGVLLDIVRQKRPFYVTIRPTEQDLGAWQ